MQSRTVAVLAVGMLVLGTAACGGADSAEEAAPAADCVALERAQLDAIDQGLKGNTGQKQGDTRTVEAGEAVELPASDQDFGFTYLAAVEVTQESEPVVLALQGLTPDAGVSVVDDAGARVFDWGTAAQPDSPMGEYQASLVESAAYEDAIGCLDG